MFISVYWSDSGDQLWLRHTLGTLSYSFVDRYAGRWVTFAIDITLILLELNQMCESTAQTSIVQDNENPIPSMLIQLPTPAGPRLFCATTRHPAVA